MKKSYYFFFLVFVMTIILFLFQTDNPNLGMSHRGFVSHQGLVLANNLQKDEGYMLYEQKKLLENGELYISAYSRFSIVPFVLIKGSMELGKTAKQKIYFSRLLMTFFLSLSLLFVFLTLKEMFDMKIAAVSTFLTFSCYYIQYYGDIIFNEIPTLFCFVFFFCSLTRFYFYQNRVWIVISSVLGVTMGWQFYSAFFSWMAIHLIFAKLYKKESYLGFFLKMSFLVIFIGVSVLGLNLYKESILLNVSLSELPTVKSIIWRLGFAESMGDTHSVPKMSPFYQFIAGQFQRISIFFRSNPADSLISKLLGLPLFFLALFMIYKGTRSESDFSKKILFISIAMSGFLWGIGMRSFTTHHDYQTIYYIGFPIIAYSLLFHMLPKKLVNIFLVFSVVWFIFQSYRINSLKDINRIESASELASLEEIVKHIPDGAVIHFKGSEKVGEGGLDWNHIPHFVISQYINTSFQQAEYVLSKNKFEDLKFKLMISNDYFLYKKKLAQE